MRAPIELDLHLPNFNFPGVGPDAVFEKLVDIVLAAERAGFTSVSVMDHYHQIPPVGPPERWMFEGNTMLAGLAARTSTIALGLLVAGVGYRNPAQHAKITTTLDVISGGRAFHGIGAGWFEAEHRAYGYAFPPLKERFERLEDHLRIARAMFTEEQATVAGTHHSVAGAYNNPKPLRGDIPILVGGSGERKTLRMVAQYADGCNLFGDPERARHLLGVLGQHCENVGRDPAGITKTSMMSHRDRRDGGGRTAQARRPARPGLPRAAGRGHDGGDAGADPGARARLPGRGDRGPHVLDGRRARHRRGRARGRDAGARVRAVRRDRRRGAGEAGGRAGRAPRVGGRRRPPHVVPCTFALLGDATIVSAVDHKPKRTTALRRLANIAANPRVALLADHYDDDWEALWWARADGTARVVAPGAEPELRAAAVARSPPAIRSTASSRPRARSS